MQDWVFRLGRQESLVILIPNRCWSVCILVRKTFKKWSNWNWAVLWIKKVSDMEDFYNLTSNCIYYVFFFLNISNWSCQVYGLRASQKNWIKKMATLFLQFDARILKICKKIMFKFQDGKIFLLFMNKKMFSLKKIILRSKG